ncbi:MAG: response regulator [Calditrichaeota bacterium]|nr:response regulator [Calditrichota bacterium]
MMATIHPYTALILDDEYLLGQMLAKALHTAGIQSILATNVDSAIQTLEQQPFDVVISDIYLPDQTGMDFFEYALEHYPDLPFIFITGNPSLETAVHSLKKGAYDYLAKPFPPEDLIDKVNDVIRRSREKRQEKNLLAGLKQILNRRLRELRIYRDIFESKNDGLLILDNEGLIVRANPGFELMSGMAEHELVNRHFDILSERILTGVRFQNIQDNIARQGEWKKELHALRQGGKKWIANCSFAPIVDEKGNRFAYSAIINDVSEFREVQGALIESLHQTTRAQEAIIFGLARLAEYRDSETGFHLEKIRSYSRELALALAGTPKYHEQVNDRFIELLYRTAPLHDIGKVGIPDHILLKQGRLDDEEYEIMKTHAVIGYQTLHSIRKQFGETPFLAMGLEITHSHHERHNGRGYPQGLKGDEIPLAAQIVSVADVYDALTSRRIYKKAFSHQASLNTMKLERGKHFAPELFDIFLKISGRFDRIRQSFSE